MFRIRAARAEDLPATETIETLADALLIERFRARDWPPATSAAERARTPGFVLVAENAAEIAGFVQVIEAEGHAHLEQLSVLPSHTRRGCGRLLVAAALDEARRRRHRRLTLRTYADVPWNASFYASCGFRESEPDTEFLRRLVAGERRLGLFAHGPRVQMTIDL